MTKVTVPEMGMRYICQAVDLTWSSSGSSLPGANIGSFVYVSDSMRTYVVLDDCTISEYIIRTTGS